MKTRPPSSYPKFFSRISVYGIDLIYQRHSSHTESANSCMRVLYTSVMSSRDETFGVTLCLLRATDKETRNGYVPPFIRGYLHDTKRGTADEQLSRRENRIMLKGSFIDAWSPLNEMLIDYRIVVSFPLSSIEENRYTTRYDAEFRLTSSAVTAFHRC